MVDTVGRLLAACGLPALEARALLAYVLGGTREALIAWPERAVEPACARRFEVLAQRRRAGEPLAYLLGEKEFYGRPFEVGPAVLVPRPETELLVDLALARMRPLRQPRVLDLGTGSGCLAITLALECPAADVTAVEADSAALAVARRNAQRLGARVHFLAGDWFAPVGGRFDVIVANAPYVAEGDPHLVDLHHEPIHALVAGPAGLDSLRRIIAAAPAHLNPGGWLLLEHGHDQAEAVRELLTEAGLKEIETHQDASGVERVTGGATARS